MTSRPIFLFNNNIFSPHQSPVSLPKVGYLAAISFLWSEFLSDQWSEITQKSQLELWKLNANDLYFLSVDEEYIRAGQTLSRKAGCLRMINVKTQFHTWKPFARYHLSGEIFCIIYVLVWQISKFNPGSQPSSMKVLLFNLSNIFILIREEPPLCSRCWENFNMREI